MPTPVSNTSPLIAFSRIDRMDILRAVAPRIVIPTAVFDELHRGAHSGEPIITALSEPAWFDVRPVAETALLKLLKTELGAGEAEALALGLELGATVIIDDLGARKAAARLGIDYVGTLGIISKAKKLGVIAAVSPVLTALQAAGIFYRDTLINRVIREEGEAQEQGEV